MRKLTRIQRKIVDTINEKAGATVKELAKIVYGDVSANSTTKINTCLQGLRKKGIPAYMLEAGGDVILLTTEKEYRVTASRLNTSKEGMLASHLRFVAKMVEEHHNLLGEAKKHTSKLLKYLLELETGAYANYTNTDKQIEAGPAPTEEMEGQWEDSRAIEINR